MSVAGAAFAVLMILIVVALYRGWSEVGSVYTKLPGNLWIAQTVTSDPYHSTSFLPAGRESALAGIDGVEAVLPVYARHIAFRRHGQELDVFAMALDAGRASGLSAQTRQRYFPTPGRIYIDRVLADQTGVGVGDRLRVLGRTLVVGAIHTGGSRIFQTAYMNAADARALFGIDHFVNFFLIATRPGADLGRVERAAVADVPRSEARTSREFAALRQPHQPGIPGRRRCPRRYRLRGRRRRDRAHHLHRDDRAGSGVRRAEGGRRPAASSTGSSSSRAWPSVSWALRSASAPRYSPPG